MVAARKPDVHHVGDQHRVVDEGVIEAQDWR
jgi:hypothetical protein